MSSWVNYAATYCDAKAGSRKLEPRCARGEARGLGTLHLHFPVRIQIKSMKEERANRITEFQVQGSIVTREINVFVVGSLSVSPGT